MERTDRFETLVEIMDRLRDPGGCPWDREQTFATLRGYLIEEAYEVAEALDRDDREGLREELGDLLFQIVFLSRLAQEEGIFRANDVVRGIAEKMIRRHPHVFGEATAETSEEVLRHWEQIKRAEKASRGERATAPSVLDGLPRALPALHRAHRLGTKAARVGFDWRRAEEVLPKIEEELSELRAALAEGGADRVAEEIGDVIFAVAMLARKLDVDPEGALERANLKFERRFRWIEGRLRDRGESPETVGFDRLEELWREAKSRPL